MDFHPIVKTKFSKDGIGGVNPNLIKSRDLVNIYLKLKKML